MKVVLFELFTSLVDSIGIKKSPANPNHLVKYLDGIHAEGASTHLTRILYPYLLFYSAVYTLHATRVEGGLMKVDVITFG